MSSYLLMMFILLFGGAILIGASLDFLGLGPSQSISLGLMMNNAVLSSALLLGSWWWFLPPGLGIIAIVGGLYVMNVGLDEVFNPKLRELMSLRVDDLTRLLPVAARRREGGGRRDLRDRRRRDHGPRRRVGLRQVDARQEPRSAWTRACGTSRGRVELDGRELPIWDDARMNRFRFKRGLDRPAVRAERAQPDAQDRHDGARSCSQSRGVAFDTVLPELERRLELVGLSEDVLGTLPDRALGRHEAARGDGASRRCSTRRC